MAVSSHYKFVSLGLLMEHPLASICAALKPPINMNLLTQFSAQQLSHTANIMEQVMALRQYRCRGRNEPGRVHIKGRETDVPARKRDGLVRVICRKLGSETCWPRAGK